MESVIWGILFLIIIILSVIVLYLRRNQNTTSHVLPVMCINLESDVVRRDHIASSFSSLSVRFVPAVDTRHHRWKKYQHHLDQQGMNELLDNIKNQRRLDHYQLTPGAVGCFLSHIRCWDLFLTDHKEAPYMLVLEDDSSPRPSFFITLQKVLLHMPEDTDIFLLSHLTDGPKTFQFNKFLPFYRLEKDCIFFLTNCYIITRSGIDKILRRLHNNNHQFHQQIDSYLSEMIYDEELIVYCTVLNMCPQSNITPTSIQTLHMI